MRFGKLTVLRIGTLTKAGTYKWWCQCDCGSPEKEILIASLMNGNSKSCGCDRKSKAKEACTKHGKAHSKAYSVFEGMMGRCYNPNNSEYCNYGGRKINPIKICDKWLNDPGEFCLWYEEEERRVRALGITAKLEIDRWPDNDGWYSESNCRLTERWRNQANRRISRRHPETGKPLSEIYRETPRKNVSYDVFAARIRRHWQINDALLTPLLNEAYKGMRTNVST